MHQNDLVVEFRVEEAEDVVWRFYFHDHALHRLTLPRRSTSSSEAFGVCGHHVRGAAAIP
jgi:hypothetical protein